MAIHEKSRAVPGSVRQVQVSNLPIMLDAARLRSPSSPSPASGGSAQDGSQ